MNVENRHPDSSRGLPADGPSLIGAVVSVFLPPLIGFLSIVAQGIWHDYYWGIGWGGKYITRVHTVGFLNIAGPLWSHSGAFSDRCDLLDPAWDKVRLLGVVGTAIPIVAGGLLLALAALAAIMGGA